MIKSVRTNPNVKPIDQIWSFWEPERYIRINSRYTTATKAKIDSDLPNFNDLSWPQENFNKLKNIRGAKVPLQHLIDTKVSLFEL